MSDLPRLISRPAGSRLVTRAEAAAHLGYSVTSMAAVMRRGGWPEAVALVKTGRTWSLLWDLDELMAFAPPADATVRLGAAASISDPDGLLTCLECGRRFRALGRHLNHAHDMTAAEYRDAHRLPATGALTADGMRQRQGEHMRDRRAENPRALDHLDRSAAYLDAIRDPERVSETRKYDSVRDRQRSGQRYAARVMAERRRNAQDAALRARGFDGLDGAIRATRGLPVRDAAAVTGLGATTIRRWRERLAE